MATPTATVKKPVRNAKKLSLVQRATKDPKLLQRALANPGLRSKLPTSMLPPEQRRTRETNVRLAQPIVAGSSITERALAREANAAANVKYSPLETTQTRTLTEAQNRARDVGGPGGFYDQYLAQVAEHANNVNRIATQANTAVAGTQNAVTGLAQADLSALQGQANAGAAARGMGPAGDLSQMSSNAAAVRQSLVGSFAAQQAAQNAAAQTYADTMARVVAPGQKLSAQATEAGKIRTARTAQEATAREKGAYAEQFKGEQRTSEAKNVLATQIATGKTAVQTAQLGETVRTHKAQETINRSRIKAEGKRAQDTAAATGAKTILTGPFTGKSQTWLSSASDADKQSLIDSYDAKKKAKGKTGAGAKGAKGPDWLTPGEMGTGLSQAASLKDLATKAKQGLPFKQYSPEELKKWKKVPLSRQDAEAKIRNVIGAKIKSPMLIRAAADAVYDGHLSAYTVKHLIAGGYKPSEIASALGTTTHGEWIKTPAGKAWARTHANTQAYSGQGNLGSSGHQ